MISGLNLIYAKYKPIHTYFNPLNNLMKFDFRLYYSITNFTPKSDLRHKPNLIKNETKLISH
jgi:hypothetical protein